MFKLLTNNWTFKVTSILFALVLWMFIMGERRLEVSYRVPLELQNIPEELMIASDTPRMVDIRISGPRTLQMKISPSDISIVVDLADLQPGLTTVKGLEERLNLSNGLKVTRLSPSYIDLKLDRIKEKSVPIKVVLDGEPLPGFKRGKVKVVPADVVIKGAETELKSVVKVITEAIDLSGVNESFSLIVPLVHEGTYTSFKNEKTAEIQVEIIQLEPSANKIDDNVEQQSTLKKGEGVNER